MVILEKYGEGKWVTAFCGVVTTDPIMMGDNLNMLDTVDNTYYSTSEITEMWYADKMIYIRTYTGSNYRLINLDFTI